jgi:hypothetical protein
MSEQEKTDNQENVNEIKIKFLEDPELILQIAAVAAETAEAIQDIAPQIELLARVNLAKSFIQYSAGKTSFDAAAFERAWTYLNGDNLEQKPEQSPQNPNK